MKFSKLCKEMRNFNKKHEIKRKCDMKRNQNGEFIYMKGVVVFKESVFANILSLERRTYHFDNYNTALTSDDIGYSIFAECYADNDYCRIECYGDEDVIDAWICEVVE